MNRNRLCDLTAERYRGCSTFDRKFVRGKLRHDPVYLGLLENGVLPARGRLTDLGCGRGILLSLLGTARRLHVRGEWPQGWPPPPETLELVGLELDPRRAAAARHALAGERAEIHTGDMRGFEPPPSSAIVVLDVLLYLSSAEQERVLSRAVAALEPGGVLLLREASTDEGARFVVTRAAEQFCTLLRGEWRRRLNYRSARAWVELLERWGLRCSAEPAWAGTPFGNVLVRARKPA